eukprot:CAMPEP_0185201838 /NCGR_PEP_ID=MMETSP1140-20130426/49986_1 /TAXON_ID=298111 /ORGANISM="Pavlova sp., Strain CCMP459" /LENGTH=213 /DNA_ID=CAMNT_0027769249 /DNA_START=121 /DNA_END=764 /DNA_ORIENTATION=+
MIDDVLDVCLGGAFAEARGRGSEQIIVNVLLHCHPPPARAPRGRELPAHEERSGQHFSWAHEAHSADSGCQLHFHDTLTLARDRCAKAARARRREVASLEALCRTLGHAPALVGAAQEALPERVAPDDGLICDSAAVLTSARGEHQFFTPGAPRGEGPGPRAHREARVCRQARERAPRVREGSPAFPRALRCGLALPASSARYRDLLLLPALR